MEKFLKIKTTMRNPDEITVKISDETCSKFGFIHRDVFMHPNGGFEVTVVGVAPGNDGIDIPWYIIHHPRIVGKACYWGGWGNAKSLQEAGFTFLRKPS